MVIAYEVVRRLIQAQETRSAAEKTEGARPPSSRGLGYGAREHDAVRLGPLQDRATRQVASGGRRDRRALMLVGLTVLASRSSGS